MKEALLLLDIGNSGAKWLSLSASEGINEGRSEALGFLGELKEELRSGTVLIASVGAPESQGEIAENLRSRGATVWFAHTRSALDGLVNSYVDPERMGVDRWLAMLAARRRARGRVCVVDAGSALTIDLVSANGEHEGGFIIPGTALMEKALFSDTKRVRDSAAGAVSILPGQSTAEAVTHGLLLAQAGAITLALERARKTGESPQLFLCGGGAKQLAQVLDCEYTLASRLVFEGLLRQAELERPELVTSYDVSSALFTNE